MVLQRSPLEIRYPSAGKWGCRLIVTACVVGCGVSTHRPSDFNFVRFLHHLQITKWMWGSAPAWWLRRKIDIIRWMIFASSFIYLFSLERMGVVVNAAADKSLIRCIVYYCFGRKSIAFGELQWKENEKKKQNIHNNESIIKFTRDKRTSFADATTVRQFVASMRCAHAQHSRELLGECVCASASVLL